MPLMPSAKPPLTPKKQPSQARSRATYDALIEAAAHILEQHGLAGFNTNAVAERAGASIGSLYQYFPNKDALMAALIEVKQRELGETLQAAVRTSRGRSLEHGVRQLVRAAIDLHRTSPRMNAAIDYEEGRLPVASVLSRAADAQVDGLVMFLGEHFPNKPPAKLRTEADVLRTIVRAIIDRHIDRTPPDFRAAERQSIRAVLGYLTRVE
jgi:AcrR family transcriptional regulator